MAAWSEIQSHMRRSYVLQRDEPNVMALTLAYTHGHDMVEFKSPFARADDVDPSAMLRENSRLPFGAVAISGEVCIVIHNAMLAFMPVDEFDLLAGRVAAAADHLESRLGAGDAF